MRSSRERFGSLRGRFRFEDAGVLCSPAQLSKMIHPSARDGNGFLDLFLRIDARAAALRGLSAWDTEGKWSMPRSVRCARATRASIVLYIGRSGFLFSFWRRDR